MSSSQSCVEISTGSSNSWEPNQKFHTLTGEVRKFDFPLSFAGKKIRPLHFYAYVCSNYKQNITYSDAYTLLFNTYNYIMSVHLIFVTHGIP